MKYILLAQVFFVTGILCQPLIKQYFTDKPAYDIKGFNRLADSTQSIDYLEGR